MRRSNKLSIDKLFAREIPKEIRNDINTAIELTKQDGREHSLTFCKPPHKNKIITTANTRGGAGFTDVLPCSIRNAIKISDFHTHPPGKENIGITPSEGDFLGTMIDSKENHVRQVGCISNHESDVIHCYRPVKKIDDRTLIKYVKAATTDQTDLIQENVGKDFDHKFYDSDNFKKINPTPSRIINNALGRATSTLRNEGLKELDKSQFCERIADYNVGNKNEKLNNKVADECREKIKERKFLGFRFASSPIS